MKKLSIIFFALIIISSCSSNDDDNTGTSNSLSGTAWFGTDDDEGEVYTFSSETDYTFTGDGPKINGTYTFNNGNGVLNSTDGSFDFSVIGDILTVEDGSSSKYIKQ